MYGHLLFFPVRKIKIKRIGIKACYLLAYFFFVMFISVKLIAEHHIVFIFKRSQVDTNRDGFILNAHFRKEHFASRCRLL